MSDAVNHPAHYKSEAGIEAIDVIEGFRLNFRLGNAIKYILRADRKGEALKDLLKARWYINREIAGRDPSGGADKAMLFYLATPYTKYPRGMISAFEDAAKLAARLLTAGYKVYSPIAHTHPLAVYGKLNPADHAIWLPFDQAMMDVAGALLVAQMPGWRESYGVNHEIETFRKAGKPIIYLAPQSLAVSASPAPRRDSTDDASPQAQAGLVP